MAKLFHIDDPRPFYEKQASLSFQLLQSSEDWEREVQDFAYRVHPWLADYDLTVEFTKKVADRQYGIGSIQVATRGPALKDMKPPSHFEAQREVVVPAHIPIIVKAGTLAPLDIFVSAGNVYPLEEPILRRQVESVSIGEGNTAFSSDPTLIGYLWPPTRAVFANASGPLGLGLGAATKFASWSDKYSDDEFIRVVDKIGAAERDALVGEDGFPLLNRYLDGNSKVDLEKAGRIAAVLKTSALISSAPQDILSSFLGALEPLPGHGAVMQFVRGPDGSMLARSTDPGRFSLGPMTQVQANPIDRDPFVTHSAVPATARIISGSGKTQTVFETPSACKATVYTAEGVKKGILYSTVLEVDGHPTGLSLFSTGSQWCLKPSLQADIGPEIKEIPSDRMGGTGTFVYRDGDKTVCTIPFSIVGQENTRDGICYKAAYATGQGTMALQGDQVQIYITQGIRTPLFSSNSKKLLVPASYNWVKIGESQLQDGYTSPQRGVVNVTKLATDNYLLEGDPVKDVVSGGVSVADAAYILSAAGVGQELLPQVLNSQVPVKLADCRLLIKKATLHDLVRKMDDKSKERIQPLLQLGIDGQLLKAAAALDDPNTIDAALGINLLETESEEDFMGIAQDLEKAQQKVARLLLLSRLGLYLIPEAASKIVMSRLTPVIDALKTLALQNTYKV